tara:strand:- start:194 stop:322 length:129 start_codon:yes stop_codon:yes gene_type:complete
MKCRRFDVKRSDLACCVQALQEGLKPGKWLHVLVQLFDERRQ